MLNSPCILRKDQQLYRKYFLIISVLPTKQSDHYWGVCTSRKMYYTHYNYWKHNVLNFSRVFSYNQKVFFKKKLEILLTSQNPVQIIPRYGLTLCWRKIFKGKPNSFLMSLIQALLDSWFWMESAPGVPQVCLNVIQWGSSGTDSSTWFKPRSFLVSGAITDYWLWEL